MNSLAIAELRRQIDTLDAQIAELIFRRIEVSNSVMKSKPPEQVLDLSREQEIEKLYNTRLSPVSTPQRTKQLVRAILATSALYPSQS